MRYVTYNVSRDPLHSVYVYMNIHVRRQLRQQNATIPETTPKKHELPQVRFELTTLCSLEECSATELTR